MCEHGAPGRVAANAAGALLKGTVAVVLAGGFGTRVRHLLPGVPKPMAPVAGRPFLEWVVRFLARQQVTRVVLSTGYLSEVIEGHFANRPVPAVEVICAREPAPLGTAGGFLHGAGQVRKEGVSAWLILNGDSLCFGNIAEGLEAMDRFEGCLFGCQVPDASRYGTLETGPAGELVSFREKRPGRGVINAGMYLLRPGLLPLFPEVRPLSFEQDVFPALTSRGVPLGVRVVAGPFLDIGTPETLKEAEAFVLANQEQFLV